MKRAIRTACAIGLAVLLPLAAYAEDGPKRLLLLSQGPDGHPPGTHEYAAGQKELEKCLSGVAGLKIEQVTAGEDWPDDDASLASADGVVLFLSEGARWLNTNPKRREAFAAFAKRGGGLAALHWGMGTKAAEHIDPFVALLGACHGGPDRKYKVLETTVRVEAKDHPINRGLADFTIKDEFYYRLKQAPGAQLVPLWTPEIDGERPMVAWAWERRDGGRSFGFSGLHFHENWQRPEYRRFVGQGVLWTLKIDPR